MRASRKINIGDHKWIMDLTDDDRISFYYMRLYYPDPKDDLIKSWDDSYDPYYKAISSESGLAPDISPFKLVDIFLKNVASLTKKSTFFYFKPTTSQRHRLYVNLSQKLLDHLHGTWECQIVDKVHYYRKVSD